MFKPKSRYKHALRQYDLYLMAIPGILIIFIFNYIPMYGIQLAFREFVPGSGMTGGEWVGMKYISRFVNSFQFWNIVTNTLRINIVTLLIGFPVPIILALMLNQLRSRRFRKTVQTTIYFPHFISLVVMAAMLRVFLSPTSGIFGAIISNLGYTRNVLGDPGAFVWLYAFSEVWQRAGWNSIIFLAALSSVDTQLYDAAKIDGANQMQIIKHIDIPALIPTIIILLVLNAGVLLSPSAGFEKTFLLQNTLNLSRSEVISTYVYKIGILANQYSYSSAINLFNNVINFAIVYGMNTLARRTSKISIW